MSYDDVLNCRIVVTAVTVTTSATAIPTTAVSGRKAIIVRNTGSTTVYLGPSTVTSSDGYPIEANQEFQMDLGDAVTLYAITASDTSTVRVLEAI